MLPAFLPFNLLKGGLNTALTLLIYKPIVQALRKANLVEVPQDSGQRIDKGKKIGLLLIAFVLLVTCIFFILVMKGVL